MERDDTAIMSRSVIYTITGYIDRSKANYGVFSQVLTVVNRALINSIGAVPVGDDGSCSLTDCLENPEGHHWCKLTAVCKKLVGYEINDSYTFILFFPLHVVIP